MSIIFYKRFFTLGVIVFAGLAHQLHNQTFSLFLFPVLVATVLPYTYQPVWLTGSLVLMVEMFSTLPPGVMTAVVIVPWIIRKIFPAVPINISGTFYALIGGTVAIDLFIISAVSLLAIPNLAFDNVLNYVPYNALTWTFLATSIMAYALLIIWDETLPLNSLRKPSFIAWK